jgi:hypothetical protein
MPTTRVATLCVDTWRVGAHRTSEPPPVVLFCFCGLLCIAGWMHRRVQDIPDKPVISCPHKVDAIPCRYRPQCLQSCIHVSCGDAVCNTAGVQYPAIGNTKTGNMLFQTISKANNIPQKFACMFWLCNIRTVLSKCSAPTKQVPWQGRNDHNGTVLFLKKNVCCAVQDFFEDNDRACDNITG